MFLLSSFHLIDLDPDELVVSGLDQSSELYLVRSSLGREGLAYDGVLSFKHTCFIVISSLAVFGWKCKY